MVGLAEQQNDCLVGLALVYITKQLTDSAAILLWVLHFMSISEAPAISIYRVETRCKVSVCTYTMAMYAFNSSISEPIRLYCIVYFAEICSYYASILLFAFMLLLF